MPDRADYLARVLFARLRQHEGGLNDKDGERGRVGAGMDRREWVAKVLAVEAGVVDGPTIDRVAEALPPAGMAMSLSGREQGELAAFLRSRLTF